MSPFLAASTKLISALTNVCSNGFKAFAGAFACPAPITGNPQPSRIMNTTKLYFIPPPLQRFQSKERKRSPQRCHSEERSDEEPAVLPPRRSQRSPFLNPPRQPHPRDRNLFPRRQILQRKLIRLHFILAHNQDVLRSRLGRRLKRFLQPKRLISQLDYPSTPPHLPRQRPCLAIHLRPERSNVNIRLAHHTLSRLFQRHHQPVFANRKPDPRSRRPAERFR